MGHPVADVLFEPDPLIAVVGASDDLHKYGAIIYRDLKRKGFRVVAVNSQRATVDGDPAYPDLRSLPETPDLIDFVVPPWETKKVLEEADALGLRTVWLQPGAESPGVIEVLKNRGFDYLAGGPCIMVHSRARS